MNDLATVKAQIEKAFAGGTYPGDWCLANSREGFEAFKGKTDWRALDPSFCDEAFRFYLRPICWPTWRIA
jgi:hypothetical protein